ALEVALPVPDLELVLGGGAHREQVRLVHELHRGVVAALVGRQAGDGRVVRGLPRDRVARRGPLVVECLLACGVRVRRRGRRGEKGGKRERRGGDKREPAGISSVSGHTRSGTSRPALIFLTM